MVTKRREKGGGGGAGESRGVVVGKDRERVVQKREYGMWKEEREYGVTAMEGGETF